MSQSLVFVCHVGGDTGQRSAPLRTERTPASVGAVLSFRVGSCLQEDSARSNESARVRRMVRGKRAYIMFRQVHSLLTTTTIPPSPPANATRLRELAYSWPPVQASGCLTSCSSTGRGFYSFFLGVTRMVRSVDKSGGTVRCCSRMWRDGCIPPPFPTSGKYYCECDNAMACAHTRVYRVMFTPACSL